MTENEAIIQLNFDMEMIRFNPSTGESLTLEQIKAHNEDNYKTYLADELAITALLEIQQYRVIGTIEEFKALKEKSVAKKPIYSDFDDNGDDEIIPYKAICPVCGNEFEFGSWNEEENHHCSCGQRINWVEE